MACESRPPKIPVAIQVCAGVLLWIGSTGSGVTLAAPAAAGHQTTQPAATVPVPPADIKVHQPQIHTWPIRVDVEMVIIGVTVTDPHGRVAPGLSKSNFKVYDENVLQQVTSFSTDDAPASVGIIFDSSGSMWNKLEKSRVAALQFFKTSNPDDEFMLIEFNERPNLLSKFTSKLEALQDRLLLMECTGRTALLDAIYLGLHEMKEAHLKRKALLVISDGGDNHSRYTEKDIRRAVKESDVQIFGIGILGPRFRWLPGESSGPALLSRLAKISGGRMFPAEHARDLPDIAQKISVDLRNEYVIGYKPSNLVRDGRWRHISVRLSPPGDVARLQVYNRSGYYAPTQ
jgi:Ca-activated chloride channel family protein